MTDLCLTNSHRNGTPASDDAAAPGNLARLLGRVGRWPWLARLLEDATIGAWIPVPALRLAWVAFVLTFPFALTTWTVVFVLRHALGHPRVVAGLAPARVRVGAALARTARATRRGLVGDQPPPTAPWDFDLTMDGTA